MEKIIFKTEERDKVMEYFGKKPEDLTLEEFEQKHKLLRAKYHPDKFEKYNNELVKEMSLAKFNEIEAIADKLTQFFSVDQTEEKTKENLTDIYPQYAGNNLYIEIITKDKELKYYLFGARYTFLLVGDRYSIKGTKASIIIDDNHQGRSIGFNESIKMYLTFSQSDSLDVILMWLYERIRGRATSINIDGNIVNVNYDEMMSVIKQKTILRISERNE